MSMFASQFPYARVFTAVLAVVVLLAGCSEEENLPIMPEGPIDPSTQPALLSRRLGVVGTNHTGSPPATGDQGPQVVLNQPSASVTANNTLFLPFEYHADHPVKGVYLAVEGADNYWDVPFDGSNDGNQVVPIGMPNNVLPGEFSLSYSLYDETGAVGPPSDLAVAVVPPETSDGGSARFPVVQGSDGLTVRTYDVGAGLGSATITWDTYYVPDRIDIRYAGEWIRSTGAILGFHDAPPIADCSEVGAAEGFIGSSGRFSFAIDPAQGGVIDVYVSGCMHGGTAWVFEVTFEPGCVPFEDTHLLSYGPFQIPVGTWMYRVGVANWLGRHYTAFGNGCGTVATEDAAAPAIYEPINVVFLDRRSETIAEARAAIDQFMDSAGFSIGSWHTHGYHAEFGVGAGRQSVAQYPVGYAWTDEISSAFSNNHGRIFAAYEWTQGGQRVFVSPAAFSREGNAFTAHDFISFNCARDALAPQAGWVDRGLRHFGNEYPTTRPGCHAGGQFVTADHNGVRLFVRE